MQKKNEKKKLGTRIDREFIEIRWNEKQQKKLLIKKGGSIAWERIVSSHKEPVHRLMPVPFQTMYAHTHDMCTDWTEQHQSRTELKEDDDDDGEEKKKTSDSKEILT